MKLEQQVCSLELAKQLKKCGVKQESLSYFAEWRSGDTPSLVTDSVRKTPGHSDYASAYYSAFTVAELGEMFQSRALPYYNSGDGEWKSDGYRDLPEGRKHISAETEADCRAKELIYLIENKLITL